MCWVPRKATVDLEGGGLRKGRGWPKGWSALQSWSTDFQKAKRRVLKMPASEAHAGASSSLFKPF